MRPAHVRVVTDQPTALFIRDGDGFRPTRLSGSPWTSEALHGGPPAALLAREIERSGDGASFRVVRMTVELLRPVPHERLDISAHLRRPGKNVQIIEATLRCADRDVARATGVRIRRNRIHLPYEALDGTPPPPGPSEGSARGPRQTAFHPGFHTDGVEHSFIKGSFATPGPGTDWIRIKYPLLEGEMLSPLCRAVAVADFGNGISSLLPDTHTYINPDLTVYLDRYPEGEWICLDSVTRVQADGIGLAESRLYDERGPIGSAMQSLIVSERPTDKDASPRGA